MRPHPKDYRRRFVLLTTFSLTALCTGIFGGNAAVLTAPPARAAEKPDSTVPEFTPRTLRYKPEGTDFVIHNGHKKYNRALYGTHSAFRIEAGDLPEFALYMPGIGGDLKLGILTSRGSKWLNDFDSVEARYRPGTLLYRLRDTLIGTEVIHLQLLAMTDREGMVLKAWVSGRGAQNGSPLELVYAYGGASGMHPARNGDLGADPPSVFYLTPAHARGNRFKLGQGGFTLDFKDRDKLLSLQGIAPAAARLHVGDARRLKSPGQAVTAATSAHTPVLICQTTLKNNTPVYFAIQRKDSLAAPAYHALPRLFVRAAKSRQLLAGRVRIHTPDPFLNTLGGTLAVAADAIWQSPAYLHGAVAWRMWLNGWRGPYCADPLGWHDRAKTDFSAYNAMQLTTPDTTIPYADPTYHLARQKEKIGVGLYNSGYITRLPTGKLVPHHYDMNLVYIDALLRHFLWTRDTAFLHRCWPVIKRDLSWEKRNFDEDRDGLYDAYACIWASDALQYSGGDVAYSSAFNYFANRMAARIARVLGFDSTPYRREATKIRHAMDSILWMPHKGWYAEYRDREGLRLLHPSAGLWTIYHAIDSKVPDAFRAYQCLRYIDTRIPHIPIRCTALRGVYYMLSTTDWMPYTWSVNNVAMAEMAHTALAYWEGGRKQTAHRIFKSLLLESQYLGSSPGNFEQLSCYDRNRGELYRDFADPIGICSRALVEGLFGIHPDQLADTLRIRPGFPPQWREASIHLPDIDYRYRRDGLKDAYTITPAFHDPMNLKLQLDARGCAVLSVRVNGKSVSWKVATGTVGTPQIVLSLPTLPQYHVTIQWNGVKPAATTCDSIAVTGAPFIIHTGKATILQVKDPQQILSGTLHKGNHLSGQVAGTPGWHTLFVNVQQGAMRWWLPVNFKILPASQLERLPQDASGLRFTIRNNTGRTLSQTALLSGGSYRHEVKLHIAPGKASRTLSIPAGYLVAGSNRVEVRLAHQVIDTVFVNWQLQGFPAKFTCDKINLEPYFNARVTQIFQQHYRSPRPDVPTLQLPVQGIGNWCSPLVDPAVIDSGLRLLAGPKGYFKLPGGISLATPGKPNTPNIVFTSRWDNYPAAVTIPLQGKASHVYFLMAGSTNPMQSRVANGKVIIRYRDGSTDSLVLKNPDTWWPLAQDYHPDGYAFHTSEPVPYRVHLETGLITRHFTDYKPIKGLTAWGIPGGAATVLDLPLDPEKTLRSLEVVTLTNDVVIGLMSVTLLRTKPSNQRSL